MPSCRLLLCRIRIAVDKALRSQDYECAGAWARRTTGDEALAKELFAGHIECFSHFLVGVRSVDETPETACLDLFAGQSRLDRTTHGHPSAARFA